jgi:hypothetical protein
VEEEVMDEFEYECAISGLTAESAAFDPNATKDELGDLPVGWTQVRISRRQINPKWVMIQHTKERMLQSLIQQTGAKTQLDQISLSLQVEAQMAPLEKTTPMYTEDVDDVVYLSDHESVLAVLNKLRGSVGLGAMPVIQQSEEPGEGEEAAQIEDKATA